MTSLTLTAKRQATFPAKTCKSLGLRPGDVVELEARDEAGGRVWVLRPRPARPRRWIGCLASFGRPVADHSLGAVRNSIAAGRKRKGGA
jgi:bifunctional DNA-binding transcriptional regulator/antitoxin component of YhaV-PrlF toxin-antitoxin module